MSVFNIASRYASAFFQYAESKNISNEIYSDFDLLEKSFSGSKELRTFLASPVIKPDKKNQALSAIFKDKISEDSWKFLLFVLEKNRENYFNEIFKRFNDIKNAKLGIIKTVVKTNYNFDSVEFQKFKVELEKFTQKKVIVEHKLDENMLGGFIARFGDTIIDASFENQLRQLKKKLIENINV